MNPLSPKQIRSLIDMWADIHDEKEEVEVEAEQEVEVETTEEFVAEKEDGNFIGRGTAGVVKNYIKTGKEALNQLNRAKDAVLNLPKDIQSRQDSAREYLGLPVADREAIRKQQDQQTQNVRRKVVSDIGDTAKGFSSELQRDDSKPNTNPEPKVEPAAPNTNNTAPSTGPTKVKYPSASEMQAQARQRQQDQQSSQALGSPSSPGSQALGSSSQPIVKPVQPAVQPAVKPSVAIGNAARTGYNPRTSTNVMKYDKNLETKSGNRLAKALSGKMSDFKFKEAYDVVLDHLLSEGHADTAEEAHYIMLQMTPEHIQDILEGA